jgi:hypothetical protein
MLALELISKMLGCLSFSSVSVRYDNLLLRV